MHPVHSRCLQRQKKVSHLLELDLRVVLHTVLVLDIEPGSPGRTVSVLTAEPSLQPSAPALLIFTPCVQNLKHLKAISEDLVVSQLFNLNHLTAA